MRLPWFPRRPQAPLIDDADWAQAGAGVPAVALLSAEAQARLRALCDAFLRAKTVSGARGLRVTPLVRATIAVQACLPVLELGLGAYRDFVEIVVYPAQFRVPRRQTDDAGVVHETEEWLVFPHEIDGLTLEEIGTNKPDADIILGKEKAE